MQVVKIVVGVLFLLGGVGNLQSVSKLPNPREAAFFLITTVFFMAIGGWLLYSGLRKRPKELSILDDAHNDTSTNSDKPN